MQEIDSKFSRLTVPDLYEEGQHIRSSLGLVLLVGLGPRLQSRSHNE